MSSFRYIDYLIDELCFGVDIVLVTRVLTIESLSEKNQRRLDLIFNLSKDGLTNKKIAEFLNSKGYIPTRTIEYSAKLIWATLKKINLRQERREDTTVSFQNASFYKRLK